ncbi:transcriptional regulator, TetR family [Streptoalloteichus tenebrarius]|uniref:Transcriptional regulator, TetR family n=2 Tax=Streptoalloteichus tenebrarius (strain ATCC 17920 / DSM 40477 / JCM 4838 / CBS 697.72 / NBRC 16177 / NCIMB 11028 / NRRL B-12390 / A12253. 1 / ISP 5477) TaxID=1933 RepID=A0ABT1I2I0_STRSD|nr:TetR/AcrR family transcriptional regulator [Streptoalloteichus tenebrarius]MCP2261955.1 transcriptional regulator, TetR family [Streptoalloteichus tenebrarius]BFF01256.1 TetR/AcrR family transcriptional regulator [Streptoalloteichus tenebrarius]
MSQILDAAAEVLAESGYESTTTNAIAARAGISPGTVYQFFANKDAIAEALVARYLTALRAAYVEAFPPDLVRLPMAELIDRMVDPILRLHLAHPGMKPLFARTDMPERLLAPTQPLLQAVRERVESVFAARAPELSAERRRRCTQVSVELFRGLLPLVQAADGAERDALVTELKDVLRRYLTPIIGTPASD